MSAPQTYATPRHDGVVYAADCGDVSVVLVVDFNGGPGPISVQTSWALARGYDLRPHQQSWVLIYVEEADVRLPKSGKPGDADYDEAVKAMLGWMAPDAAIFAEARRASRCMRPDWRLLLIPEEYEVYNEDRPREVRQVKLDATTREEALQEARPHALEALLEDNRRGVDQPLEWMLVVDIAADLMRDESIAAEVVEVLAAEKARKAIESEQRQEQLERADLKRLQAKYGAIGEVAPATEL